jgi:hypothetical protein
MLDKSEHVPCALRVGLSHTYITRKGQFCYKVAQSLPLVNANTGRDQVRKQAHSPSRPQLGEWASIGEGRLLLTSHRLLWQGPEGELDFKWSAMTAIYLWLVNTLGIRYGTARYRFPLNQEVGLKWLTHAGTLAQQVPRRSGYELTLSPF